MMDPKGFREEVEKFIILIQQHPYMHFDDASWVREDMWVSSCNLLGYIDEQLYPGIIGHV
jgi:hypothetical protein